MKWKFYGMKCRKETMEFNFIWVGLNNFALLELALFVCQLVRVNCKCNYFISNNNNKNWIEFNWGWGSGGLCESCRCPTDKSNWHRPRCDTRSFIPLSSDAKQHKHFTYKTISPGHAITLVWFCCCYSCEIASPFLGCFWQLLQPSGGSPNKIPNQSQHATMSCDVKRHTDPLLPHSHVFKYIIPKSSPRASFTEWNITLSLVDAFAFT